MGKPKGHDSCHLLAACAVAIATAVNGGSAAASEGRAIEKLEQYCSASWRNAGIKRDEWDDCTQQALTELLEQVQREGLPQAIENGESLERRELNRAIWRLVQRQRRKPRLRSFDEARTLAPSAFPSMNSLNTDWERVSDAASTALSDRQRQILELSRAGYRVAEIAEQLRTTPQRVSDEKYKAIAKLRGCLGIEDDEPSMFSDRRVSDRAGRATA